ncbi:MAG: hypothetical protein KBS70_06215 [Bacteroidales bacterium]|nr:hypothetical protein [Candidatus Colicola equi]
MKKFMLLLSITLLGLIKANAQSVWEGLTPQGVVGPMYTFSSVFPSQVTYPLGLGVDYFVPTTRNMSIPVGFEMGFHLKKEYHHLTHFIDQNIEQTFEDPSEYYLLRTGIATGFFTFTLGMGVAVAEENKLSFSAWIPEIYDGNIVPVSHHNERQKYRAFFMIQPALYLNIPYVVLKIGYNYTPQMPHTNGIVLGLGIEWNNGPDF